MIEQISCLLFSEMLVGCAVSVWWMWWGGSTWRGGTPFPSLSANYLDV